MGQQAQRDTLARLATTADVICLQEGGWLVRDPADIPAGWQAVYGTHQALPILYRVDLFTRAGSLERMAYADTRVGPWGAGPGVMNAGWDYGVRLDRDGRACWVFNAHLVPSVTRAKPAGVEDGATWELRRKLYTAEVRQIVDITSWIDHEPVFVCGDFNAEPDFDLLTPMRKNFEHVTRPTHGVRAIDHIWYRNATPVKVWEVPTASDHDALGATFD